MGLYTVICDHEMKLSRQLLEEVIKIKELRDQIEKEYYCEMKYRHVKITIIALDSRNDLALNTKRKLNLLKFWLEESKDYNTLVFT